MPPSGSRLARSAVEVKVSDARKRLRVIVVGMANWQVISAALAFGVYAVFVFLATRNVDPLGIWYSLAATAGLALSTLIALPALISSVANVSKRQKIPSSAFVFVVTFPIWSSIFLLLLGSMISSGRDFSRDFMRKARAERFAGPGQVLSEHFVRYYQESMSLDVALLGVCRRKEPPPESCSDGEYGSSIYSEGRSTNHHSQLYDGVDIRDFIRYCNSKPDCRDLGFIESPDLRRYFDKRVIKGEKSLVLDLHAPMLAGKVVTLNERTNSLERDWKRIQPHYRIENGRVIFLNPVRLEWSLNSTEPTSRFYYDVELNTGKSVAELFPDWELSYSK